MITMKGYAIFDKNTEYFKYGVHWESTCLQLYKYKKEANIKYKITKSKNKINIDIDATGKK